VVDHVSKEKRSEIMRSVRAKDTRPELFVRRLIFSLGYRYRLHCKDLPGKPDLVFSRPKKAIFIHGCFWHYHGCKKGNPPRSRKEFWLPKLENNRMRDQKVQHEMTELGWKVLVIWQCEIRDTQELKKRLIQFLGKNND
jgi:DNA mismatch endonuclease (patch repair protein)